MSDTLTQIKKAIGKGDLETAIQLMLNLTENDCPRYHSEMILHQASFNQLLENERKQTLNPETLQIQRNRLISNLLELTKLLEQELNNSDDTLSPSLSHPRERTIIFTSPVEQVIIDNQGEIYKEKTMNQEKVIHIGGNAQISAPVVIADSIQNSFNTLAEASVNDDLKTLLQQLLNLINEVNKNVPSEQAEIAQNMAQDAETLVKETSKPNPRRKWYEMSLDGLKEAATSLGEIATPILEIVTKITEVLP